MASINLSAKIRTEFGKGASRRARREGLAPAVMYGGEVSGVHLLLDSHAVFLIVKDNANAVVNVTTDDGKEQLALVREVQVHPVRREIQHVDLLAIKKGEKVEVEVPLSIVGESAPGTIHTVEEFTIKVLAPATAIPESIEVSIDGLDDGDVVRVSDITFPADVECELDPEQDVVAITIPREEVPEPETEEAPEAAEASAQEGGEGEGEE